jgi:hypothetical protein
MSCSQHLQLSSKGGQTRGILNIYDTTEANNVQQGSGVEVNICA